MDISDLVFRVVLWFFFMGMIATTALGLAIWGMVEFVQWIV